jgi:hypothetical protein
MENMRGRVHGQGREWFERWLFPGAVDVTGDHEVITKFCAKLAHWVSALCGSYWG